MVARELSLAPSDTSYDWVGPGIYFWESDPLRAWEWANGRARDGDYDQPAVVGAIIKIQTQKRAAIKIDGHERWIAML